MRGRAAKRSMRRNGTARSQMGERALGRLSKVAEAASQSVQRSSQCLTAVMLWRDERAAGRVLSPA